MNNQKMFMLLIILFIISVLGYAEDYKKDNSNMDDSLTSTTVTHIEYSPLGLVKIEMPKFSAKEVLFGQKKSEKVNISRHYSIFPVRVSNIKFNEYEITETSFLKIPFWENVVYENIFKEGNKIDWQNQNPIKKTWQIDKPLFSIANGFQAKHNPEKEDDKPESLKWIKRARIFDTLVLSLIKYDEWGKEEGLRDCYCLEVLDAPLITTFELQKCLYSNSCKILKIPFVNAYEYKKDPNEKERKILNIFFLGNIFKSKTSKTDNKEKWTLVETLPLTLASSKKDDNSSKITILEAPSGFFNLLKFELWHKEKLSNGTECQQYLKLPLIGPLYSYWKKEDKEKKHVVFPRLLFWKYPKYVY